MGWRAARTNRGGPKNQKGGEGGRGLKPGEATCYTYGCLSVVLVREFDL